MQGESGCLEPYKIEPCKMEPYKMEPYKICRTKILCIKVRQKLMPMIKSKSIDLRLEIRVMAF